MTEESPLREKPCAILTGKERDPESGLDYFGARYYWNSAGRFTSPDEMFANWDQNEPQTFNLYAYADNNPMNRVDPDGRAVQVCVSDRGKEKCIYLSDDQYRDLYKKQNGRQGIDLPGGLFPNGDIVANGRRVGTVRYFEEGLQDATGTVLAFYGAARLGAALGQRAVARAGDFFARASARETVVIGKMRDLRAPGALGSGERELWLDDLIDPKANWAQNSSALRLAMREGRPIRDASVDASGQLRSNTGFLRAERNLLQNNGWKFRDGYWHPPTE